MRKQGKAVLSAVPFVVLVFVIGNAATKSPETEFDRVFAPVPDSVKVEETWREVEGVRRFEYVVFSASPGDVAVLVDRGGLKEFPFEPVGYGCMPLPDPILKEVELASDHGVNADSGYVHVNRETGKMVLLLWDGEQRRGFYLSR